MIAASSVAFRAAFKKAFAGGRFLPITGCAQQLLILL